MTKLLFPFGYAAIIALGFLPPGFFDRTLPSLVWALSGLPLAPILIAILAALNTTLPPRLLILSAVFLAIAGTFVTVLAAAGSGAGGLMAMFHGMMLTVSLCASLFFLSPRARALARLLALPAILAACWSLLVPLVIAKQATALSGERPYCLAHHAPGKEPVDSWAELRGFSFYTTRRGYKDSSVWFLHGLLNVDGRIYNWSPRRLTFHEMENPGLMTARVTGACDPETGFLKHLPLIRAG